MFKKFFVDKNGTDGQPENIILFPKAIRDGVNSTSSIPISPIPELELQLVTEKSVELELETLELVASEMELNLELVTFYTWIGIISFE